MKRIALDKWMADWCKNTDTRSPRFDYTCEGGGEVYAVAITVYDARRGNVRVPVTCYANSIAEVCGYAKRGPRMRWGWKFTTNGDLYFM